MRPDEDIALDDATYYGSAAPLVPPSPDLEVVRQAAMGCRACHLWRLGTQTVFGEGSPNARIMFVGEQPGDKEDLAGRPFVGPSGELLAAAMEEAGIARDDVYITNAVKHFKWIPQAGRRLHQKPNAREIRACLPWLEAELARIKPKAVLLGATAAQSILGSDFKLTKNRGRFVESDLAPYVLATLHPSAILRMPDQELREASRESLVEDLRLLAANVDRRPRGYVA
ncbi:UdgX family uracil-DNA binding protein [Fimbriimonas ginsengisoli]|uniref:Type-4 uracil-DNA glycosylase n=1 Tax=Fimbriimonas ginsengisoli Gsoil 348 TaxID=661478 RepID=A0A068NKV9_FIMGI|nr:UdgX family uracil-DNA binding protein [Fimbriimonas ginsengisoli]AIE84106.1 Uracil-DNA glycosylase, putative family 6 [Fimbriimonas ginsengisoli Gsoil 348]